MISTPYEQLNKIYNLYVAAVNSIIINIAIILQHMVGTKLCDKAKLTLYIIVYTYDFKAIASVVCLVGVTKIFEILQRYYYLKCQDLQLLKYCLPFCQFYCNLKMLHNYRTLIKQQCQKIFPQPLHQWFIRHVSLSIVNNICYRIWENVHSSHIQFFKFGDL